PAEALRERILHIPSRQKPALRDLPARPPQFCPGCGHRGLFHVLSRNKITVNGDIGCYSLGALPPHNAMDTLICMGASIGMDHGFSKVPGAVKKSVAVIGDSTFFHSGMTNLVNVVNNGGTCTTIILDNFITAMTGHQTNPGTGRDIHGSAAPPLNIAAICRALGVRHVVEAEGLDVETIERVIREETERPEPSVIVVKSRCVISEKGRSGPPYAVLQEACKSCNQCLRLGCAALTNEDDEIEILTELCDGCGLCADVCKFDAIVPVEVPT
ncbi:4Fe-4S binding protein, partial [Candidatus Poribacteria bacterium]|nr:4Fe-4S binding protein [Candidatus Poribacteria bacterium]